jgi:hypothetical protein
VPDGTGAAPSEVNYEAVSAAVNQPALVEMTGQRFATLFLREVLRFMYPS